MALLWGLSLAVLALLLFARPEDCNAVAIALWLTLIAPLVRWTWNWFGAREATTPESSPSEEDDGKSWPRRLGRGVAILVWILVAVGLLWAYLECSGTILQFS